MDPADPGDAEHWLIVQAEHRPRLRRVLVHLDRRVFGGVAVAVCLVAVLTGALLVGWVFVSIDSHRGFARWDQAIAAWGPQHPDAVIVDGLRWATHLGDTTVLLVLLVVVGLIDWCRRRVPTSLWFLLTVGAGVLLVNNALKRIVMRQRPPVAGLVSSAGSAFPSGHSAAAAACWLAVALVIGRWMSRRVRRWASACAVAIALLVATSRALLAVHWLTDVVAGLIVGWACFFVIAIVYGGRLLRFGDPVARLAADAVAGAAEANRSSRLREVADGC